METTIFNLIPQKNKKSHTILMFKLVLLEQYFKIFKHKSSGMVKSRNYHSLYN